MKNKHLLLTMLITFACVFGGGIVSNSWAQKVQIDGIYYNLSETNATVTYTGNYGTQQTTYHGDIVIPSSFTYNNVDYSVVAIGNYAFYSGTDVLSVTIPSTVTSIGTSAFQGCTNITSATIPNSVTTIGSSAFSGCSRLATLVIGSGVTTIQSSAFYNCTGLTDVTLNANLTSVPTSSSYAFKGCTCINACTVTICSGVTSIPKYTFTNLTNVKTVNFNATNCSDFPSDSQAGMLPDFASTGGTIIIGDDVTNIPAYLCNFKSYTAHIIIGSSVTNIGTRAFYNSASIVDIISKPSTPPTIASDTYYSGTKTYPVYVPFGSKKDYSVTSYWSTFNNYIERCEGTINATDNIELTSATIIESGATLNMGIYDLSLGAGGSLTIEDGGQLITGSVVAATVKKNISAYTSADDGWNLISSPVSVNLGAAGIGLITESTYDLYYLNEETSKWINYKEDEGNDDPGFNVQPQKGYLYANAANTSLSFSGNLQPNIDAGIEVNLTKAGEGWNLVGNPFPFNAYVDKSYYVINGRTVEVYAGSDPVPTCTGIIVKATGAENEKITFRKTPFAVSAINNGNLELTLAQAVTTRGNAETLDNAIVSFNEGSQLEKFYFGTQDANLYIPQGDEEYAIVNAQAQGEMLVNFRANENGQYTLTVNTENVEMNYLHLIDNMTGTDIDLLATPSYTFNAKTTDYESRFRLLFATNGIEENNSENASFAFFANGNLIINNEGEATLQIFDMLGHQLECRQVHSAFSIPDSAFAPGVYVLRLVNGESTKVQKIVIQ